WLAQPERSVRPVTPPRPASPSPRAGWTDADQAPVLPAPPRRLPTRPLDEVPVLRGDAVPQAARQGPPRLPVLRSSLPPLGRGAPRAPPRPRHVRRARWRPPVRGPADLRRPEGLPGPDRGGSAGDRHARRRSLGNGCD